MFREIWRIYQQGENLHEFLWIMVFATAICMAFSLFTGTAFNLIGYLIGAVVYWLSRVIGAVDTFSKNLYVIAVLLFFIRGIYAA